MCGCVRTCNSVIQLLGTDPGRLGCECKSDEEVNDSWADHGLRIRGPTQRWERIAEPRGQSGGAVVTRNRPRGLGSRIQMLRPGFHWRGFALLAIPLLCAAPSSLRAQNGSVVWPRFRGDNGSGVALHTKALPVEFGRDKNLLWSVELPRGVSSPCIWEDRIFLTGCDAEKKALITLCVARTSGKILWQHSVMAAKLQKMNPVASPAASTPASDGQSVYVNFGSYGMLCYDFDGRRNWEHRLPVPKTFEGSGSSPIVVGGVVILVSDQLSDWKRKDDGGWDQTVNSFIVALDQKTGELAWKLEREISLPASATPIVHRQGDSLEILTLGGGNLIAYDVSDGSERWRVGDLAVSNVGTPVIASEHVFFTGSSLHGSEEYVVVPPSFDDFLKDNDAVEPRVVVALGKLRARARASRSEGSNLSVSLEWLSGPSRSGAVPCDLVAHQSRSVNPSPSVWI